jgi:uncharacterized protein (UPF0262 family)
MNVSDFIISGEDDFYQTKEYRREREIAVRDFLDEHRFAPTAFPEKKIKVTLSARDKKFIFIMTDLETEREFIHIMSSAPFRKIFKEYGEICDGYRNAVSGGTPAQIETLDMARRGLHNEAADLIVEKFKGKIMLNRDTARKLFTILYGLR